MPHALGPGAFRVKACNARGQLHPAPQPARRAVYLRVCDHRTSAQAWRETFKERPRAITPARSPRLTPETSFTRHRMSETLHLDIVIPTHNRAVLLERTLASITRARKPANACVSVIVVDNNCHDDTPALVRRIAATSPIPIRYVAEKRPGSSHARNAGIAASSAVLIGMIDDDEEIAEDWIEVVARCFADRPDLHFAGGPYRGNWSQDAPPWLPPDFRGVIGVLDSGTDIIPYDDNYPGILLTGNAVVRREWLERAGGFNTALGRTGTNLMGGEDTELYRRLLVLGAKGEYRPDLVILHHIPPERLTKAYFRRWVFFVGRSKGRLDRSWPEPVPYVAAIPRYRIRKALGAIRRLLFSPGRRRADPGTAFSDELHVREFIGFATSRWFGPS